MIEFKTGNIFDSKCDTLVNTVNCVGIMGKGLALQFKEKYPHMFTAYKTACAKGMLKNGGDLWCFDLGNYIPFIDMSVSNYPKILCFATKQHWRNPSKIEWIKEGLTKFKYSYKALNINSIAFPKLGCTNGKLDWENEVKPLMIEMLKDIPIKIEIYE